MEEIKSIELTIAWKETLKLNLPLEGIIIINKPFKLSQDVVTYKIEIISKISNKVVEIVEIDTHIELDKIFCGELLRNNIYIQNIQKSEYLKNTFCISYSFTNPYSDVFIKLEEMRDFFNVFGFKNFVTIEGRYLIVKFKGAQVGGSYVPARKRAVYYRQQIEEKVEKSVKYLKHEFGRGLEPDFYFFSIDLYSNVIIN